MSSVQRRHQQNGRNQLGTESALSLSIYQTNECERKGTVHLLSVSSDSGNEWTEYKSSDMLQLRRNSNKNLKRTEESEERKEVEEIETRI